MDRHHGPARALPTTKHRSITAFRFPFRQYRHYACWMRRPQRNVPARHRRRHGHSSDLTPPPSILRVNQLRLPMASLRIFSARLLGATTYSQGITRFSPPPADGHPKTETALQLHPLNLHILITGWTRNSVLTTNKFLGITLLSFRFRKTFPSQASQHAWDFATKGQKFFPSSF